MKTAAVAAAFVAAVAAYDASDLPECWSACFNQYDVDTEGCLCSDDVSKVIDRCIRSGCDSQETDAYESWLKSYCEAPAASPPAPPAAPVVTNTKIVYETAPCPTRTPGEVYETTTTESITHIPHEKSYDWGSWSSKYTSWESSTCTGEWKVTVTHPYPTEGAPTAPPSYPTDTGSWGTGSYPEPTKKCSKPEPTPKCVPCEGQGKGKYCGLTIDDNSYENTPITCNVVEYEFEITETTISPDGVERPAFLVNNQFPGPLIEASWGDTIVVKLTNSLKPDVLNGTTIHFHGIRQHGTNEYDGVSSVTQCPLAPGETMTYKFVAASYGTSWWHSHYSLQTYEGIFGPLVIHGPASDEDYDGDQVLLLSDWNHATVDSIFHQSQVVVPGVQGGPITIDTGLINGKNVWEGAGEYYSMTVEAGKRYRLRLINTAIQSTFKFHIDGHSFSVIAMDFVPIHPYSTDIISINIGQRYDVILTADQAPGNYWIRSDNQQPCGPMLNPYIQGILNYKGVDVANPTTTGLNYPPDCLDEASENLVPIVPLTVGAQTGGQFVETSIIAPNGGNPNLYKWTLSGSTFLGKWEDPTLYDIWATGGYPDYDGDLTISVPNLGEWVYFVIDSPMPLPHPIHLHGHDFFVLASGVGAYTGDVALSLDNPPRRDVAVMPADPLTGQGGYLVIAYQTDNPGVWLLHCHIGWHNSMGFALQIIENLEAIKVEDSCAMEEVCAAWDAYANQYNVFNAPWDAGV